MVLTLISGDFMAALIMAAGLAALMSTMDSQLLTLSSIFTRDIAPIFSKKEAGTSLTGRIFVIFLSLAGLALAYKPPATILQIATQTFTGLAVLFPTVIFGLYFRKVFALPAILSIIVGEGLLLCFYFKLFSAGLFLPVIWVMALTFTIYLSTHTLLSLREKTFRPAIPGWLRSPYFFILAAIFFLAMDFWAWGKTDPIVMGIPLWMAWFVLLSAVQTVVMVIWVKQTEQ